MLQIIPNGVNIVKNYQNNELHENEVVPNEENILLKSDFKDQESLALIDMIVLEINIILFKVWE